MVRVQALRFGVSWSCGVPVASPLRIEFGQQGHETTVDGMLRGEGHTLMWPEQLAHLVAGMVMAPATVQMTGMVQVQESDRLQLQSTLSMFGYTVELC